jgi:hypothetical protein
LGCKILEAIAEKSRSLYPFKEEIATPPLGEARNDNGVLLKKEIARLPFGKPRNDRKGEVCHAAFGGLKELLFF